MVGLGTEGVEGALSRKTRDGMDALPSNMKEVLSRHGHPHTWL